MKKPGNFFWWIVLFAAGIMITIAIAQVITQKSFTDLQEGNSQATITFKVNNRLQEMVNLAFELENKILSTKTSNLLSTRKGIKDSLTRLGYNTDVLKKIWADTTKISSLNKLVKFVDKQVELSFGILSAAEKKNNQLQQRLSDSLKNDHLGDSIYAEAISFQKGLEQNLGATLEQNNKAASQLSLLNRLLAAIALISVLVLATIIIRRQVKQLLLIKDLEVARKTALQSAEAKDQFLANMSHEIRTPLNAIKGFGKILAKTPLTADQQKYASIISIASENLLNIVNDILDFSKIETGNLVLKKKAFHPVQIISEVEMMFTSLAQEKELGLIFSVDASMPGSLKGDPERLRQILVNLLSNAIKFTYKGDVKLEVVVKVAKENVVKVKFDVTDTGVGIPPEKIDIIFERFEQLDYSFTRQHGGTGLGLAITKKLVEAMGGKINVVSEVNKGSRFTVEIEFEKINENAIGTKKFVPVFEIENVSLDKMQVLVAEDNKMNQLLVNSILEKYEICTEVAENGEEAIEMALEKKYDLILMDVQMPKTDGITATRKIRERIGMDLPIIAMTAHVLAGERDKCIEAGMNDYITKPLDEEELVIILKRYFSINKKNSQVNELFLLEAPWLNNIFLKSICNNEEKKIRAILKELQKELPIEIKTLRELLKKNDITLLKRFCHHVKSTLSPLAINAEPFVLLNQFQEVLAGSNEFSLLQKLGNQLIDSLQSIYERLDTILSEKAAGK
ncbi:MAG: ATP-binding protein [Chitinophagaceae bacterium]